MLVRLQPDQLAQLDNWIEQQAEPRPGRPEAVRRVLRDWFAHDARQKVET